MGKCPSWWKDSDSIYSSIIIDTFMVVASTVHRLLKILLIPMYIGVTIGEPW